ncbi:MAG: SDR family NAD(P)-dependent oxidoreductase [Pseudomonadota bacterium]
MTQSPDSKKLCVVVGAGTKYASNAAYFGDSPNDDLPVDVKWGLGGALPIAFAAKDYDVVIMSRAMKNLTPIETYITSEMGKQCLSIECDVSDIGSIQQAFAQARAQCGDVDVLCYNAGYAQPPAKDGETLSNPMGGQLFEDLDIEKFNASYAVHASGLLQCAKEVLPSMRERSTGSVLVTGNTMSLRGGAKFGLNAPSKFAQRAMTQVMAQEYKDFGVHVAHIIVDGALDAPGMRTLFAERSNDSDLTPESIFLNPAEVAETFVYMAEQPQSVWTHEISLTPRRVKLGQRL